MRLAIAVPIGAHASQTKTKCTIGRKLQAILPLFQQTARSEVGVSNSYSAQSAIAAWRAFSNFELIVLNPEQGSHGKMTTNDSVSRHSRSHR